MPPEKDRCYKAKKHNCNENTRKQLARLGNNEKLVLFYALRYSKRFTISDIATQFGLKNKRIWDVVQRLIARGFIRKIDRGIYELSRDIDISFLSLNNVDLLSDKENLSASSSNVSYGRGVGGVEGVVRIHGNGKNVLEYFRRLYFSYKLLRCVVKRLEVTLVRLGYSKSFIRNVEREINRVVDLICYSDGVVGCHGRYGHRRFSGLKPLSLCGGHYYEYGVDIDVSGLVGDVLDVVGKPFIKIYLRVKSVKSI